MANIWYLFFVLACITSQVDSNCGAKYTPHWSSLDARPSPQWYDSAKFGIFVHWGVYSVPSWAIPGPCCPDPLKNPYAEWYWRSQMNSSTPTHAFHQKTYGSNFKYQDFAPMFKAELFQPDEWAQLFKDSGAKYVVLTSKHHEGFTLWPSPQSWNWNSMDVGPNRDLVGDLSTAVRNIGLKFGLYYSLYEWYNPIYRQTPKKYIKEIMLPQLHDIVNTYKPSVIWGDGCLDYSSDFWETKEFLTWLFNESPVCDEVAVNDRWGNDTLWKHGGFLCSEYEWPSPSVFGNRKWEDARGMGYSFGYNRLENATIYSTPQQLINLMLSTVSKGGNLLLNVGPTADGRIPVEMQQTLLAIGSWLKVNGDAIYNTTKWSFTQEDDTTFYTWNQQQNQVYAITTKYPYPELELSHVSPTQATTVQMLGVGKLLKWKVEGGKMVINIPVMTVDEMPCQYAYSFAISNVEKVK